LTAWPGRQHARWPARRQAPTRWGAWCCSHVWVMAWQIQCAEMRGGAVALAPVHAPSTHSWATLPPCQKGNKKLACYGTIHQLQQCWHTPHPTALTTHTYNPLQAFTQGTRPLPPHTHSPPRTHARLHRAAANCSWWWCRHSHHTLTHHTLTTPASTAPLQTAAGGGAGAQRRAVWVHQLQGARRRVRVVQRGGPRN